MAHYKARYRVHAGRTHIELNLRRIEQLFDSRDPSPFLERDLDENAVDYIVSAAMEHSLKTPLTFTIHISEPDSFTMDHATVVEAVHNYFSYYDELNGRKLRAAFRQGQFALLTGLITLFACLAVSQSLRRWSDHSYITAFREGLTIMGWVAMWRPFDMFLYSWRPQLQMQRMYRKLSQVPVEIRLAGQPRMGIARPQAEGGR